MKFAGALLRATLIAALTFGNAAIPRLSAADCFFPPDGRIVTVSVQSCEAIEGPSNVEVMAHVGASRNFADLEKMYTGALVTEANDVKWMYPSQEKNPCGKFAKGAKVKMRAYMTCCDSGRWGKCVFGGRWLTDIDAKPIDPSQ
jgi:hypothetical protein